MLGIIVMFVAVAVLSCFDITGWKVTYFVVRTFFPLQFFAFPPLHRAGKVSQAVLCDSLTTSGEKSNER